MLRTIVWLAAWCYVGGWWRACVRVHTHISFVFLCFTAHRSSTRRAQRNTPQLLDRVMDSDTGTRTRRTHATPRPKISVCVLCAFWFCVLYAFCVLCVRSARSAMCVLCVCAFLCGRAFCVCVLLWASTSLATKPLALYCGTHPQARAVPSRAFALWLFPRLGTSSSWRRKLCRPRQSTQGSSHVACTSVPRQLRTERQQQVREPGLS